MFFWLIAVTGGAEYLARRVERANPPQYKMESTRHWARYAEAHGVMLTPRGIGLASVIEAGTSILLLVVVTVVVGLTGVTFGGAGLPAMVAIFIAGGVAMTAAGSAAAKRFVDALIKAERERR